MAYTLAILLWGLATWRVTRMLWTERGPLDVFVRLRAKLATIQKHEGGIYDMVSCFYCLSIWVAVIPALILATGIISFIGLILILSAIAIFLQKFSDKLA